MTSNTLQLKEFVTTTTSSSLADNQLVQLTRTIDNVVPFAPKVSDDLPSDLLTVDEFTDMFVNSFDDKDEGLSHLSEGRRWVAEAYYADDGVTVRTLRLKKGLSQSGLADALSTSQSHVARIEKGSENIQVSTCRRLCGALDIDMNILNAALLRQEELYRENLDD